jgi:hypothetical protein
MKPLLMLTMIAAGVGWVTPAAHAGAEEGVRCPGGFSASFSSDNRTLLCTKSVQHELASICTVGMLNDAGAATPVSGQRPTTVVLVPTGVDSCRAEPGQWSAVSAMAPPGPQQPPASAFTRLIDAIGPDKFVATGREFAFPEGGPGYDGKDASRGVSCPMGVDGFRTRDGRGLRCEKRVGPSIEADCADGVAKSDASGWRFAKDHVGAEDRCMPPSGGSHVATKPQGITRAQHELELQADGRGWVLSRRPGERDTWQRVSFRFPERN